MILLLGSPLRPFISSAIIKLNEEGVIGRLKAKWWEKERGGGACLAPEDSSGGVTNLNIDNFGGIFVVLAIGIVVGFCVALIEKVWAKCCKGRRWFF